MKTQYPKLLRLKLSEIQGAGYNPRKITSEAMGRLTKSLADLGDLQPITINIRTGNRIIGGHQRFKIYQAMGRDEIDVWAVDLPEEKEKVANLALNNLAGEFDNQALKDLLEEIDQTDIDLQLTGFSNEEIEKMMLATPPEEEIGEKGETDLGDIEMIPLYIEKKNLKDFLGKIKKIGEYNKVEGTAEIIKDCVDRTYGSLG